VPLTVCPLSNVKLRRRAVAFPSTICATLLRAGVARHDQLSDDPAYFGGYIGANYRAVAIALDLSPAELTQLAANAVRASFLPAPAKAALLQFDEDLDQLGDACDLCPFRAVGAGGDVDADGDGVGDACDPGPEQHEWVYFTGFGVDDGQWTHSGGNWEVGGGSLTQSRSQTDLASARLPASMFTAPGVTLTVGGRVTEVGGIGRYLWLSVGEQGVGVDQTYLTCTHNTPTTGASIVAIEQFVMGDYNVVTSVPAAPLVSGGFELVAQSEPGGAKGVVRCTIGLSTGERLSLSLVAPQPTTGARGVYVEDLAVALDWAAVIALR
jgi:hypothetical protein